MHLSSTSLLHNLVAWLVLSLGALGAWFLSRNQTKQHENHAPAHVRASKRAKEQLTKHAATAMPVAEGSPQDPYWGRCLLVAAMSEQEELAAQEEGGRLEERMFKSWSGRSCCQYLTPDGAVESWLTLTSEGLGCKLCSKLDECRSGRSGLASGSYQVRRGPEGAVYLYERTFKEHTGSRPHVKALEAATGSDPAPRTPAPGRSQSSSALSPAAASEPGSAARSASGSPMPKSLVSKIQNHMLSVCSTSKVQSKRHCVFKLFLDSSAGTSACSTAWQLRCAAPSWVWLG